MLIDDIFIATTNNPNDAAIEKIAEKNKLKYFKGSEDDVLDRFYKTLSYMRCQKPEYVIRVTSDCPLIDPCLIDEIITSENNVLSNENALVSENTTESIRILIINEDTGKEMDLTLKKEKDGSLTPNNRNIIYLKKTTDEDDDFDED